jgi:hypothetical protein
MSASGAPTPEIGGPTSAAWREEALARAEGLSFLLGWIRTQPDEGKVEGCRASIEAHLAAARETATGSTHRVEASSGNEADRKETQRAAPPSSWGGRFRRRKFQRDGGRSPFERTLANLDMAEVDLLRLAKNSVLEGALPSIQAHVNRFLAKDDPRRLALDELSNHKTGKPPSPPDDVRREQVLNALYAANTQRRRNLTRVQSFRFMLRAGIVAGVVLAVALGVIGLIWPHAIPLCFSPEADGKVTLACPQGTEPIGSAPVDSDAVSNAASATVKAGDILLVEFLGLVGAALSVIALFRGIRKGTSTPYNVAFHLAILKLPAGALTAVSGLLLIRADFVPGLSALDSPAQILGWALVFGIAQQLVTQVADNRAHTVLEDVGGRGAAGDRPLASTPPN